MDPTSGAALARFEQECRRRAASGQHVASSGFGRVSVEDLVRFQALHTRHPCKQMPGATLKTGRPQGEPANTRLEPTAEKRVRSAAGR
jgi:hypothetical protein